MLFTGKSDKYRDVNIAQLLQSPAYEENDSNLQKAQAGGTMSQPIAGVPDTGVRHCTAYALPPLDVALLKRKIKNVDGN